MPPGEAASQAQIVFDRRNDGIYVRQSAGKIRLLREIRGREVIDQIDGRWLIKGSERLGEWNGATQCAAES